MSSGRDGDDDVLVLPPLPADPLFIDAVEDAVAGPVDDLPDLQPERPVGHDPRDFASLYIRHRASFGLHARRFLNDPRDVEEVLQEGFLRLFLAMPELETELQALAYCRRTVTNLCIDRYRADQRRPRLVDLDALEWDPSDEKSYDDPVLRAEDAAIVRQALALLTPIHRAALVKREIEEKPLPQIADELGIPEENVKHLLHRARRALRRLLAGTSVEPGVDLSDTQLLRLANERLARATLRSTNVLIALFVTVVAVVGGLRASTNDQAGTNDQETRRGDVGAVVTPQLGGAHGNPVHPMPAGGTPSTHRHPSAGNDSSTPRDRAPGATAPHPIVSPVPAPRAVHTPNEHFVRRPTPTAPRPETPADAPRPAYVVRGALQVTGPVAVRPVSRDFGPAGTVSSTTQLVAPTLDGAFVLNQYVNDDPVNGAADISLQPVVTTGAEALTPSVHTTSTVSRTSSGDLSIDVSAVIDPSETPETLGAFQAHIVLGADYLHVLSETVTVQAAPSAPASAAGEVLRQSTAEIGVVSDTPVPLSTTPTVIGMSTKGVGDQEPRWSSSTDGGSFPLLPPSPAGP